MEVMSLFMGIGSGKSELPSSSVQGFCKYKMASHGLCKRSVKFSIDISRMNGSGAPDYFELAGLAQFAVIGRFTGFK